MALPTGTPAYSVYVGIDIAARSASVAMLSSGLTRLDQLDIEQSPASYADLQSHLQTLKVPFETILVVMENTGTYWMPLARFLHQAGCAVSVVNPLAAKHFFRFDLKRDKNDRLDAFNLAELGALLHRKLRLWYEPPPIYEELRQRLAQRDGLTAMKTIQLQQRHALQGRPWLVPSVKARRDQLLTYLNGELRALDREIEQLLLQDSAWGASARRLMSIKGIGLMTASWLLVATVNFTTCDSVEQIASYVGLVPRQNQSGDKESRRHIGYSGHPRLRHLLYLAAVTALRYNPPIKRYYERLIREGKPGKVAVIACARKLLGIAWACVKYERMFDPDYHTPPQVTPPA
ncbi:MAG: IS110 family transposase [Chloroflexota bacterium]